MRTMLLAGILFVAISVGCEERNNETIVDSKTNKEAMMTYEEFGNFLKAPEYKLLGRTVRFDWSDVEFDPQNALDQQASALLQTIANDLPKILLAAEKALRDDADFDQPLEEIIDDPHTYFDGEMIPHSKWMIVVGIPSISVDYFIDIEFEGTELIEITSGS